MRNALPYSIAIFFFFPQISSSAAVKGVLAAPASSSDVMPREQQPDPFANTTPITLYEVLKVSLCKFLALFIFYFIKVMLVELFRTSVF